MATRLAEVFLALLVVSITKYAPTSYFKLEANLKGEKWFKLLDVAVKCVGENCR